MERTKEIDRILGLYEGPEPERVRDAVLMLGNGNIELISYYMSVAMVSPQDLLRCAAEHTDLKASQPDPDLPPPGESIF